MQLMMMDVIQKKSMALAQHKDNNICLLITPLDCVTVFVSVRTIIIMMLFVMIWLMHFIVY